MKDSRLREELEYERDKLNNMIKEAMDNGRPVSEDERILKQSQKVDALLNRIQKKNRENSR